MGEDRLSKAFSMTSAEYVRRNHLRSKDRGLRKRQQTLGLGGTLAHPVGRLAALTQKALGLGFGRRHKLHTLGFDLQQQSLRLRLGANPQVLLQRRDPRTLLRGRRLRGLHSLQLGGLGGGEQEDGERFLGRRLTEPLEQRLQWRRQRMM